MKSLYTRNSNIMIQYTGTLKVITYGVDTYDQCDINFNLDIRLYLNKVNARIWYKTSIYVPSLIFFNSPEPLDCCDKVETFSTETTADSYSK